MKVINRRGSYQQAPAPSQKKAEGKKRKSPCTPFREKAKGKESDRRVLSRNRLSRADARATARSVIAPYPGLDRLVAAALDADLDTAVGAFNGSADDRRIWASIAWRVGVEEFHFALMDKLAEDAADGTRHIRNRAAAFQAFLNERFPNTEATRDKLCLKQVDFSSFFMFSTLGLLITFCLLITSGRFHDRVCSPGLV